MMQVSFHCPKCESSLIYQKESSNCEPCCISGACLSCGATFSAEETIDIIFENKYLSDVLDDNYYGDRIYDCPECGYMAYALSDKEHQCYCCEARFNAFCVRCSGGEADLGVAICYCCQHMWEKF